MSESGVPRVAKGTLGDREFIVFLGIVSAMAALAIDTILPAFGQMRETFDLAPDSTSLSLTITLFFLGNGLGFFVYGPLSDSIGRRRVLQLSLSLYALAAFVGAFAPTLTILYLSRFVWGFASGGPRIISQAIVRDRWSGQEMAKVMTLIQTFFYIGPIFGPIIGRGLVEIGSWRWVFVFGTMVALALILWSGRLPETLAAQHQRRFDFRTTFDGMRIAASNPVTRSYGLAIAVGFGAFYSFLASSELLISDVFGRPDWFVPVFITLSVLMAIVAFTVNRLLQRVAAADLVLGAGVSFVIASAVALVIALATSGTPAIGLFLPVFGWAVLSHAAMFPTATSLALDPMGALAGTAAAAMGASISFLGAFLAALIDRAIAGSVTPMAVGFLAYSIGALALQLRGRRALGLHAADERAEVDEAATP